jgi:DNA processing protein
MKVFLMPLPGKWQLESVLKLVYSRQYTNNDIRNIVQSHSLGDMFHPAQDPIISGFENDKDRKNIYTSSDLIKRQIDYCESQNFRILTIWDDDYPQGLKDIEHPPVILYVKGNISNICEKYIGIVGTRRCSFYGKMIAERFSETFANNGIVVVSGLANGIDTISHLATIKNKGITWAVIASGLDCLSPSLAVQNSEKIIEGGGCIISEYPCGVKAKPVFFPQRNRIISGISKAVVVIESGKKGGALITAQFAFDQSKEVYAVPGNINSEKSIGTNELIRKNVAQIATSPEQVLIDMGWIEDGTLFPRNEKRSFVDMDEAKIYELLDSNPLHVDEIAATIGMDMPNLLVKLLNLEFSNAIRQLPGKYYIRN